MSMQKMEGEKCGWAIIRKVCHRKKRKVQKFSNSLIVRILGMTEGILFKF